MEAIALIFTKFSEELLGAQIALLCFASALAAYWFVLRKKKRQSADWVPAALVRAYLDRVRTDEREIRMKLFGEESLPVMSLHGQAPLAAALGTTTLDPAQGKEIEALRAQLTLSDQKALEFDRMLNSLRAEKTALEQKLATAPAGSAGGEASAKELAELKAKLQEYEVIEDDLANLKKFQKENEALKQKVEQYEKGGAAPAPAPVAAAPTLTVVSGGAEAEAKTVISGAAPAPEAPAPAPVAAAPAPETNTNVLAPVTPTVDAAAPAPAGEKSAKQKEEELLSEFEKMLAS